MQFQPTTPTPGKQALDAAVISNGSSCRSALTTRLREMGDRGEIFVGLSLYPDWKRVVRTTAPHTRYAQASDIRSDKKANHIISDCAVAML